MIVLLILYGALAVFELFLMFRFQWKQKQVHPPVKDKPVSILVCARNEAHNLADCLNALIASDYDFSKVELLIGDDNSEDDTRAIAARFSSKHSFIKVYDIQHEKDGLIAKGNVLAQLVDYSTHEIVLIIDADMIVSRHWLKTMVGALSADTQMLSGYTQILRQKALLVSLQYFDWQVVLHSMKAMADLIRPISILGNNMGFQRSAYNAVGGWRGLGPTDVEDLGLLQLFQAKGFKTSQLISTEGFAQTKPQLTLKESIEQRCRWMNGVFTHHFILALPAFFARLWLLVFAVTLCFSWRIALVVLSYGTCSNIIKFLQISRRANGNTKFPLLAPWLTSLLDTFALIRLAVKGKVSWKGRKH
ncbi:glycosyltransferase [Roseivirga pacifica]|uniref:glycosyltransferase n=1 Tax=Roseivirga pacifica TaxID=1267423 RepID=UPI003BACA4CA